MTTPPSGRPRLTHLFAALACALLPLSACHAGTTEPTPAPTTHVATQDAPTSSSVSPAATSSDALYQEAERVFRAYYKEHEKAARAGGFRRMPAEMAKYADGSFADGMTKLFSRQKEAGARSVGGDFTIVWIRGVSSAPVRIRACTDASTTVLKHGTQTLGHGTRVVWDLQLTQAPRGLVISSGSSKRVAKC